jgi:glycerophosphoryl diester phosphodiesterase
MRIISHRGNLDGPIPERENSLSYIDEAIEAGYNVEIDIRTEDGFLYLGHDFPQHRVPYGELYHRKRHLWVHCKDIQSFYYAPDFKSFCHTGDPFVLVTPGSYPRYQGWVWVHDLDLELTNLSIIPLLSKEDIDNFDLRRAKNIYGICTDYPNYLKSQL